MKSVDTLILQLHTTQSMKQTRKPKFIAFNPSSESGYIESNSLKKLIWNLRHVHEMSGSLIKSSDGKWIFARLEIFELSKHPKLIQEFEENEN